MAAAPCATIPSGPARAKRRKTWGKRRAKGSKKGWGKRRSKRRKVYIRTGSPVKSSRPEPRPTTAPFLRSTRSPARRSRADTTRAPSPKWAKLPKLTRQPTRPTRTPTRRATRSPTRRPTRPTRSPTRRPTKVLITTQSLANCTACPRACAHPRARVRTPARLRICPCAYSNVHAHADAPASAQAPKRARKTTAPINN